MMHLLLGERKKFETDGENLLIHILRRYSVHADCYRIEYCYNSKPPSKARERAALVSLSRRTLESIWLDGPGPIIGFGWMPCELLTGKGKTKLKDLTGTCWDYVGTINRSVWISYDPAGALYNPNLVVDIAAVIKAAGVQVGMKMPVNPAEPAFNWQQWI